MRILLKPVDSWVFRDGKPFTAGEDRLARSIFPPTPYTVVGALRSHLLLRHCGNPRRYGTGEGGCGVCDEGGPCAAIAHIGPVEGPPPWRVGPLHLTLRACQGPLGTDFFPVPADLACHRGHGAQAAKEDMARPPATEGGCGEALEWAVLRPVESAARTDLEGLLPLRVPSPQRFEGTRGGWLDRRSIEQILEGRAPDAPHLVGARASEGWTGGGVSSSWCHAVAVAERRLGIGIDPGTGTVQQGLLYAVEHLRLLDGWGLAMRVEGLEGFEGTSVIGFGGEGRKASLTVLPEEDVPALPSIPLERFQGTRRVKAVLLSPAFFRAGWKPSFLEDGFRGVAPGTSARLRLAAAAVPRAVSIGGWSLAQGGPRPMRPAVPAGAVFFFEVEEGDASEVAAALQGRSISDRDAEYGFGIVTMGVW